MKPVRWTWIPVAALTLVLGRPALATNDFVTDVIRGLEVFGFQFDVNHNPFGAGDEFNYAADYRGETEFDFGFGSLVFENAIVGGSVSYTTRGVPKVSFDLATTTNGVTPTALDYTWDSGLGPMDITVDGEILININAEINQYGFYDVEFYISNRGTYSQGEHDPVPLDYDVGPITASGNIYRDALARLTDPFFEAAGTENPYAQPFVSGPNSGSAIEDTAEELRDRLKSGELLSDKEITALVNNTILASMLGTDPSDELFNDLLLPEGLLLSEAALAWDDVSPCEGCQLASLTSALAPEPGALALLLFGALALIRRR